MDIICKFLIDNLALVVSVLALVVSGLAALFTYQESRRSRTSSIFTELMQQMNLINESTVNNEIKGPYSVLLGIEGPKEVKKHEALGATFFYHINLLHIVYRNRKYLGENVKDAYKEWAKEIFWPWVESKDELKKIYEKMKEKEDLLGKDFIDWIERAIK